MNLTTGHIIGIVGTLALMTGVGLYAGRKVKTATDFTTGGGKVGWLVIAGTILGTLIGGASTIGTAQLAFEVGFSAWWWTLGGGIACAVMGLFMVDRLWASKVETIPQYLVKTYGPHIGPVASIFTSVGILFNVIAASLAFIALLMAMFPISAETASAIGGVLILSYVIFGGIWGAGMTGFVKVLLVYLAMITCGVTAYMMLGGFSGMTARWPSFPTFSLFGRGFGKDFAAGFSMVVGVLSTQTYVQAVLSGKSAWESRKAAFLSALLSPPVGLGGILVGLYMRANFPQTASKEVFPVFILKFLPTVLAGIVLAALFITIVTGMAGLILGISTMLTRDIYQKIIRPKAEGKEALLMQRLLIVVVCLTAIVIANFNREKLLLDFSFMSMGLRGCTVLFPLLAAMFLPRLVTPLAGVAATVLGPLVCIGWYFYPLPLPLPQFFLKDPLYMGLLASLATLAVVSLFRRQPPWRRTERFTLPPTSTCGR
jgi:SSS family solute:Na+ symporter